MGHKQKLLHSSLVILVSVSVCSSQGLFNRTYNQLSVCVPVLCVFASLLAFNTPYVCSSVIIFILYYFHNTE